MGNNARDVATSKQLLIRPPFNDFCYHLPKSFSLHRFESPTLCLSNVSHISPSISFQKSELAIASNLNVLHLDYTHSPHIKNQSSPCLALGFKLHIQRESLRQNPYVLQSLSIFKDIFQDLYDHAQLYGFVE